MEEWTKNAILSPWFGLAILVIPLLFKAVVIAHIIVAVWKRVWWASTWLPRSMYAVTKRPRLTEEERLAKRHAKTRSKADQEEDEEDWPEPDSMINCRCTLVPRARACGEPIAFSAAALDSFWRKFITDILPFERLVKAALRREWDIQLEELLEMLLA